MTEINSSVHEIRCCALGVVALLLEMNAELGDASQGTTTAPAVPIILQIWCEVTFPGRINPDRLCIGPYFGISSSGLQFSQFADCAPPSTRARSSDTGPKFNGVEINEGFPSSSGPVNCALPLYSSSIDLPVASHSSC